MAPDIVAAVVLAVGLVCLSLVLGIVSFRRTAWLLQRTRTLDGTNQVDGVPVSELLVDLAGRIKAVADRLNEVATTQISMIEGSKQYIQRASCVRYNAYEDTGSDLSFSVAILDSRGAGLVMSGLYGRDDMRMYAKPVEGGRSPYVLTNEEKQAILLASPK